MFKVIYNGEPDVKAGKAVMGETMQKMIESDPDVVYLDADLMNCIGTNRFNKKFPKQAIECGIEEANMVGVAAGLSAVGKKPYAHTFGAFAGRRVTDQAFMSVAYARNNVRLIGSDPGVEAAYNGGTHMPFEDICIYRAFPETTIIELTDSAMVASLLPALKDRKGLTYIRFTRKGTTAIYSEDSTFEVGKGNLLQDGTDVTLIACGREVAESMKAAQLLKSEGISAAVIDMFTIKPLDEDLVAKYAKKTGAVVTAENGNVTGGLGAAVSEFLSETNPTPVIRIGAQDKFGQVGDVPFLADFYHLTAKYIVDAAKKAVSMKK